MSWLALALTALMVMASVGDFLFGDSIAPATRRIVYSMYWDLEEDWRYVYRLPAFLISSTGKKILRYDRGFLKIAISIAIYSLCTTLFLSIMTCLYVVLRSYKFDLYKYATYVAKIYFVTVPGTIVGDLFIWPVSLKIMSHIQKNGPIFAILSSIVLLCVAYFVAGAIQVIGFVIASAAFMLEDGIGVLMEPSFYEVLADGAVTIAPALLTKSVYSVFFDNPFPGFIIQIFQISLPAIALLWIFLCVTVIYPMKNILKRPLLFLLERIEFYPKSIFLLIGGILSSIVTIVAAWLKAGV